MPQELRREFLISFGIIIGGLIVAGAASFFLSRDVAMQAGNAAEARELIRQRAATLGALADLKKGAPQAAVYRTALDKILVSEDQLLDFPRWLDGLARGRGVSLNFSFAEGQIQPEGQVPGSVGFSVDINGRLDSITGFLNDIELGPPRFLLGLEDFKLSGEGNGYSLKIKGRIYFR